MLRQVVLKPLETATLTGKIQLHSNNTEYKRIQQSARDILYLETLGFVGVTSSNVSAVGKREEDLLIRFHNETIYRYPSQASHYEPLLGSNSKGKYVWINLRKPNVSYKLEGKLKTPSGSSIDIDYEDLDRHYSDEYKRFNIPIQESTGKMREFLSDLKTHELDLIDVANLLKI